MEERKNINSSVTLALGALITLALTAISVPIGTLVLKQIVDQPFYLYAIPLAILVFAAVGLGGLRRIKVAHQGILLVLGKRLQQFLFLEGWHWILPLFTALEEIDTRKIVKRISQAEAFTKDRVRIKIDATIEYQVVDPYSYLSLGEKVVEVGFEDLTKQVLRMVAIKKDLNEALGMQQELNNVLRNVLTPERETDPEKREQYGISEELDKATKEWGIDVINVFVSETQPPEEIAKQLEKSRTEKAQQEAEAIEAEHIRNLIEQYTKAGLSLEEATLIVQTERDKAKRNIDEKRIVIPERTGQILKDIAESFKRR